MTDKVLLSIHHRHAEKILSGEKVLEIRKTAPSCDYPYIIYLYETKSNGGAGAVVGFFECACRIKTNAFAKSTVYTQALTAYRNDIATRSCLTEDELYTYANGKPIYGLVVRTAIRFPRPRALSEFGISRPPQSWQYIK